MDKKAQIMGLPFQMIFSIILIAIFLYVGFTAIKAVMSTGDTMKIANFVSSFRNDLEKTMATTESTQGYKYSLPSSIKMVCFSQNIAGMNTAILISINNHLYNITELDNYKARNLEGSYVIFYPRSAIDRLQTSYYAKTDCQRACLNLSNSNNPKCFEVIDGVISLTLCKTIGDPYARFDCVAQPAPPTTGGGCTESWSCTSWSPTDCPANGQQTRTCTDANSCGTTVHKPAESKTCTYNPPAAQECSSGQTRSCPNQLGVCSGSYETCTASGTWPGCDANIYEAWNPAYGTEITGWSNCFDSLDNDCDGKCDELGGTCGLPEGDDCPTE